MLLMMMRWCRYLNSSVVKPVISRTTATLRSLRHAEVATSWQRVDLDAVTGARSGDAWRYQWRQYYSHSHRAIVTAAGRPVSDGGRSTSAGARKSTRSWVEWSSEAEDQSTWNFCPSHVPQRSSYSRCCRRLVDSKRHPATSRYA